MLMIVQPSAPDHVAGDHLRGGIRCLKIQPDQTVDGIQIKIEKVVPSLFGSSKRAVFAGGRRAGVMPPAPLIRNIASPKSSLSAHTPAQRLPYQAHRPGMPSRRTRFSRSDPQPVAPPAR